MDDSLAEHLFSMLAHSPLRHFDVLSAVTTSKFSDSFWTRMVESHGERLQTVSVHYPPISLDTVREVCRRCVQLEELFVVVEDREDEPITDTPSGLRGFIIRLLNDIADGLSLAPHLRRVHLKLRCPSGLHPTWQADDAQCFSAEAILDVVRRCSSTLTLFGLNTHAWEVRLIYLQVWRGN
jgi:hypothetical protein